MPKRAKRKSTRGYAIRMYYAGLIEELKKQLHFDTVKAADALDIPVGKMNALENCSQTIREIEYERVIEKLGMMAKSTEVNY